MDAGTPSDEGSIGDIPTRPMRVKILYTFDTEAKTSCLARFPETLNIPVVPIDEQSQVGVIELRQCVQTIVSASPEILSKLENGDFSVYSFDYAEYETPIVGQGKLSALLAASPSPDNKTMVTGRVCKNIQALFSNGVKEILEVKFKLTPLSKPASSEFARNTDSARSMSPATSSGFDPNAWNTPMQQNKSQQQSGDYFNFDDFATTGGDNGVSMMEQMFGMPTGSTGDTGGLQQPNGVGMSETLTEDAFAYNPAFAAQSHSAPGSRAGSPIVRPASSIHNDQLRHQSFSGQPTNFADQSRPGSRGSVRSETAPSQHRRQPSQTSFSRQELQQQTDIHYNEDGNSRKRAKVTQTDWRGKSSFGSTKSSDLRVTAATASSMHMFRPIAKRPSAPGTDLEPPPRVPTPVPQRTLPPTGRQQSATARSRLRQASTVDSDFMSDMEPMSDAMTSPEGSSPSNSITADGTPMDIPSSPPLIPGYNLPTPSSPGLPTFQSSRMADSGYMSERGFNSGTVVESFEMDERRRTQEPFVKTEGSVAGDISDFPGDFDESMTSLPPNQGNQLHLPAPRQRSTTAEHPPSETSPNYSQTPQPDPYASRRSSLALPKKHIPRANSEAGARPPAKQKRKPLNRSRTTSNDSEAGSPAPSDTERGPKGTARSGSAAPRRKVIEKRLTEAIARGEMPVYCAHCGAIETPTWRKIYVKTMDGRPGPLDSVEGEGETIGVQALDTDLETGEVTRFLIRKTMKKTKDMQPGKDFVETNVCNPCGLWFNKFRNMRPKEKWHRKPNPRKRKGKSEDDLATDGIEPPSEAFFTDQIVPEDTVEENNSADDGQSRAGAAAMPAPARRPRANSFQDQSLRGDSQESDGGPSRRGAAMRRETQSSPVRFNGSQESPIEVDLTPKPTRRLLFPSPRQSGEMKSLEEGSGRRSASTTEQSGLKISSVTAVVVDGENNVDVFKAFSMDKENMAPPLDETDDLAYLFEGSPTATFKTPLPKTPSKKPPPSQKRSGDMLLRTPTQSSRKRQALTPNQNAMNNADMNANDFMTSPSSARYFLRSTPSRLERTPGGRSVSGGSRNLIGEPSPFSRHLAQMLNESVGPHDGVLTSPSRQFDYSDLPTFTTPGRDVDWKGLDELLSSEFATFDSEQPGGGEQQ